MPVSIPKGVVKGAMFRAAMICNNLPDLFVEFEFVLYRMWKRGFKKQDVANCFSFSVVVVMTASRQLQVFRSGGLCDSFFTQESRPPGEK